MRSKPSSKKWIRRERVRGIKAEIARERRMRDVAQCVEQARPNGPAAGNPAAAGNRQFALRRVSVCVDSLPVTVIPDAFTRSTDGFKP